MYKRSAIKLEESSFPSLERYRQDMEVFRHKVLELFTQLAKPFRYPETREENLWFKENQSHVGMCLTNDFCLCSAEIKRLAEGKVAWDLDPTYLDHCRQLSEEGKTPEGDYREHLIEVNMGHLIDCSRFTSLFFWMLALDCLGEDFVNSVPQFSFSVLKTTVNIARPLFQLEGDAPEGMYVLSKGTVCYLKGVNGYGRFVPDGFAAGCWVICIGENDNQELLFKDFSRSDEDAMTLAQWKTYFDASFREGVRDFSENKDAQARLDSYRDNALTVRHIFYPELLLECLDKLAETGKQVVLSFQEFTFPASSYSTLYAQRDMKRLRES